MNNKNHYFIKIHVVFVWEGNEVRGGKAGVGCKGDGMTLAGLCKVQSSYVNWEAKIYESACSQY